MTYCCSTVPVNERTQSDVSMSKKLLFESSDAAIAFLETMLSNELECEQFQLSLTNTTGEQILSASYARSSHRKLTRNIEITFWCLLVSCKWVQLRIQVVN